MDIVNKGICETTKCHSKVQGKRRNSTSSAMAGEMLIETSNLSVAKNQKVR